MSHNCFPFTPIIMKIHTKTPHMLRMCHIDFEVKDQGHNALMTENGLRRIIAFSSHLPPWNFTQRLLLSWECAPLILFWGQKVKVTMYWFLNIFLMHNCFSFAPIIMKLHTKTPLELRMCPIDFGVKRSKVNVTMHWFLKMFSWHIIALSLRIQSWNFTHRPPWVEYMPYWYIDLSKCQRSSQCIDFWKCFLGTLSLYLYASNHGTLHIDPHESSICPIDISTYQNVKGQGHNAVINNENGLWYIIASSSHL